MDLSYQLKSFIVYIIIGNVLGVIFDFFRASRKSKKIKIKTLMIQDIIYFILVTIIIIFTNIFILKHNIRFYYILGLIIGIFVYITLFSNIVIKNFTVVIDLARKLFSFIILPVNIFVQSVIKIFEILYKILKKCCKKIKNMISYIISVLNIRKRGIKYEKKRKSKYK